MKLTPEQRKQFANWSGDMNGWTTEEADLFFDACERAELDPYSRQIYPMRKSDKHGNVRVSAGVTIDGFRIIASRTGKYRGQVGPFWCGPDGAWKDVWLERTPPSAAKVGVVHTDFADTLWAVARFDDYAQTYKDGHLNPMWLKMGPTMVAKCAEALALRRAFPERLSGFYTSDEMAQAANPDRGEEAPRPNFDPSKTAAAKKSPIEQVKAAAAKKSPIEQVKAAAAAKGIELAEAKPEKPATYTADQAKTLMAYLADKAIELDEIAAGLSEAHGIDPELVKGDLTTWAYSLHPKVKGVIKDIIEARAKARHPEPESPAEQLDFSNEE